MKCIFIALALLASAKHADNRRKAEKVRSGRYLKKYDYIKQDEYVRGSRSEYVNSNRVMLEKCKKYFFILKIKLVRVDHKFSYFILYKLILILEISV